MLIPCDSSPDAEVRRAPDGRPSILSRIGAQALGAGKPRDGRFPAVFAALIALCIAVLVGCSRPPPEQALRETIAAMQAASEARDADALFAPIADDFTAEGMDRQRFRGYVAVLMLRNRSIGASIGPLDVQLLGDRARVDFTVFLTGGPGTLPESANAYRVQTGWRMQDGEWTLISASWEASL